MFKRCKLILLLFALVSIIGCSSGNNSSKITLLKDIDENIGAVTTDGEYVYYSAYDMKDTDLFPKATYIKRVKKDGGDREVIFEFLEPLNISYIKKFKDKFILVGDDQKTDTIYVLKDKDLEVVESSKSPVGEINPSYSGEFVTWIDKDKDVCKLDLNTLEIEKISIDNIYMKKFERPFNFSKKTYVFQAKNMDREDANEKTISVLSIDWESKETKKVFQLDKCPKNCEYLNLEVSDSYIKWEEKSRNDSKINIYDKKENKIRTFGSDKFQGYIKNSFLARDSVYVFDEVGQFGIEVLDIKKDEVLKLEDIYQSFKEEPLYSPIYPYRNIDGFVSRIITQDGKSAFIILED